MTYEQIEADCIRLGVDMTMSREQVAEMNKDDEYEPFLARKRSSIKHVKPTLEVHINAS